MFIVVYIFQIGLNKPLDEHVTTNDFSYFSTKTYVMGIQ